MTQSTRRNSFSFLKQRERKKKNNRVTVFKVPVKRRLGGETGTWPHTSEWIHQSTGIQSRFKKKNDMRWIWKVKKNDSEEKSTLFRKIVDIRWNDRVEFNTEIHEGNLNPKKKKRSPQRQKKIPESWGSDGIKVGRKSREIDWLLDENIPKTHEREPARPERKKWRPNENGANNGGAVRKVNCCNTMTLRKWLSKTIG